jgi:hypothetical protein
LCLLSCWPDPVVRRGVGVTSSAAGPSGPSKRAHWADSMLTASDTKRQYVARPPDRSNTEPVLNAQSSDDSHKISEAASSGNRKRFMGIFESM